MRLFTRTFSLFGQDSVYGYIFEKKDLQTYCPNCEKFLADRELVLQCPNCGRETKAEECDCGYNPNSEDLKKARCQTCGANVIEKENENLYIQLTKLQEKIEKYYEQNKKNWRKNSQNETQKYLTQGLIDSSDQGFRLGS